MIRSFIALEIAPPIRAKIAAAAGQLAPQLPGVRWVNHENYHLTLKFLGDIDESRVGGIGASLARGLRLFPRCTINAKGLGVFPDLRQPRILWVGFDGPELIRLATVIEECLGPLGFVREERGFQPHLTIGRWRQNDRHTRRLEEILRHWRAHDFGGFSVNEVILFQSRLTPERAFYSRLKSIELASA